MGRGELVLLMSGLVACAPAEPSGVPVRATTQGALVERHLRLSVEYSASGLSLLEWRELEGLAPTRRGQPQGAWSVRVRDDMGKEVWREALPAPVWLRAEAGEAGAALWPGLSRRPRGVVSLRVPKVRGTLELLAQPGHLPEGHPRLEPGAADGELVSVGALRLPEGTP